MFCDVCAINICFLKIPQKKNHCSCNRLLIYCNIKSKCLSVYEKIRYTYRHSACIVTRITDQNTATLLPPSEGALPIIDVKKYVLFKSFPIDSIPQNTFLVRVRIQLKT